MHKYVSYVCICSYCVFEFQSCALNFSCTWACMRVVLYCILVANSLSFNFFPLSLSRTSLPLFPSCEIISLKSKLSANFHNPIRIWYAHWTVNTHTLANNKEFAASDKIPYHCIVETTCAMQFNILTEITGIFQRHCVCFFRLVSFPFLVATSNIANDLQREPMEKKFIVDN